MKTKRVLTEQDAKAFFQTSINTLEDAFGHVFVSWKNRTIRFDFNAALLLSYPGIYADVDYPLKDERIDTSLLPTIESLNQQTDLKASAQYIRSLPENTLHFNVKQERCELDGCRYIFICKEKLLDTEEQLERFSRIAGSGLGLFTGSTWWTDYDESGDWFYCSDAGPNILGIPLAPDHRYRVKDFQVVREQSRQVSEFYDQAVAFEMEAYEKVRRNETDFFAGRTPTITDKGNIVWVEAYGKCILRYPDGSPRFFVAIDIYLSEIHEEKTQLELLTNLFDIGLISSDVGIWYHQRHYLEGRYYFTESYQKLMSDHRTYTNDTITDLLNEQIALMEQDGHGYESFLHEFRRIHNSIYTEYRDKYHLIIPNFKNPHTLQWIDVRGTVIERDEEGHVVLFVGVNVDVTESHMRNRELERLRIQNERLQLAESLAIKARDLMVWYQELEGTTIDPRIFGNDLFVSKLGLDRTDDGLMSMRQIRESLVVDDAESRTYAKRLTNAYKDIYRGKKTSFDRMLAKHRHLKTGDILYIEHSVEVTESDGKNATLIGGVLLDVTHTIEREHRIRYLADYDTLSDLYNRNYFERYIERHLPKHYTIILYDLDGLKLINDVYGHMTGDRIIKRFASFLKRVFPDALFIARIGGDEFAVLCETTDEDEINRDGQKLIDLVASFNVTSDIEMTFSVGGKLVKNNEISFDKAFVQAENIMYRRKLNNRSSRKSKVLESIMETLNAKTEETAEHSKRMADLAVATMRKLHRVRASEIEDMQLLARVHDIGKITIDDAILKKPGRLTDAEFEIIKRHAEAGYNIIRNITDSDEVCNGVLLHHERWDGNGYPQGLKGEAIPLFARIIAVVDAFDAMTNDRIYQAKRTTEDALREIQANRGTQFDPSIVDAFLAANYPNFKQ
jgi:diguanylate cyclase (GGDEF)-like protein